MVYNLVIVQFIYTIMMCKWIRRSNIYQPVARRPMITILGANVVSIVFLPVSSTSANPDDSVTAVYLSFYPYSDQ